MIVTLTLPYPPSVNHYYIRTRRGVILTPKARLYHKEVGVLAHKFRNSFAATDKISLAIDVYPPDKRRRDISNLIKCIEDALQYAKVFHDDFQVESIKIERKDVVKGGSIVINISNI